MTDDIFALPDEPLGEHHGVNDPKACRAVKIGPTGIEWICIAEVHATLLDIQLGRARIDRHHYVRRYPKGSH